MEKTITLNLLNEEAESLFNKAMENNLSVSELLENFIADLTYSNRRNGSDESDLADSWLERCNFPIYGEMRFCQYLASMNLFSSFLDDLSWFDDVQEEYNENEDEETKNECKEELEAIQEVLKEYYEDYCTSYCNSNLQSYEDAIKEVRKYKEQYTDFME